MMPALLSSTSMRPWISSACASTACHRSSLITNRAPSPARRRAAAAPMPPAGGVQRHQLARHEVVRAGGRRRAGRTSPRAPRCDLRAGSELSGVTPAIGASSQLLEGFDVSTA